MAIGRYIQTGTFVSDGSDRTVLMFADVDRFVVENQTEMAATNSGHGFRYTWFLNLGRSIIKEYHPVADHTVAIDIVNGAFLNIAIFYARDTLDLVSVTAGTDSVNPVYSTADTGDLEVGSTVRFYDTNQMNLNGLDFTVDNVVTNTSFRLANTLATAPGVTAGAGGVYMNVSPNQPGYESFAPYLINIANITKSSTATVTTLTTHSMSEGLYVKFCVPAAYGMVEIDGLTGRILSGGTDSTFSVDIDSSAFTAFTFPTAAAYPFDMATLGAVSEEIPIWPDNQQVASTRESYGYVAMRLTAGSAMPGGSMGDEIRWIAYNSKGEGDDIYNP